MSRDEDRAAPQNRGAQRTGLALDAVCQAGGCAIGESARGREFAAVGPKPTSTKASAAIPIANAIRNIGPVFRSEAVAETDRVLLRPWHTDEADRFFDMHRRVEVARWIGGRPMADRTEAAELIKNTSARLASDLRFGSWAIVERATHVSVRRGACSTAHAESGRTSARLSGRTPLRAANVAEGILLRMVSRLSARES